MCCARADLHGRGAAQKKKKEELKIIFKGFPFFLVLPADVPEIVSAVSEPFLEDLSFRRIREEGKGKGTAGGIEVFLFCLCPKRPQKSNTMGSSRLVWAAGVGITRIQWLLPFSSPPTPVLNQKKKKKLCTSARKTSPLQLLLTEPRAYTSSSAGHVRIRGCPRKIRAELLWVMTSHERSVSWILVFSELSSGRMCTLYPSAAAPSPFLSTNFEIRARDRRPTFARFLRNHTYTHTHTHTPSKKTVSCTDDDYLCTRKNCWRIKVLFSSSCTFSSSSSSSSSHHHLFITPGEQQVVHNCRNIRWNKLKTLFQSCITLNLWLH